ncbi:MAG: class I SAM-dependent methyltransferase [Ignavibacteriales bacterium]|nr:class I SAM-dependent methyltransferase [Ignavibacteriales bacterium]
MEGRTQPPEKESRREHWETFWEEKENVAHVYSNEDRILRNLQRVGDLRGMKILEIGAGTGRDSFPLMKYGAEVVQLDYAENSLRILKRLAENLQLPARIVGGDTFQLPFQAETFDVVFHQGLLEHFRHPQAEALLKENIRVLKTGGILLVDVPQRYHLYTLAKHLLMAVDKWFAGWERSFSVGELKNRMQTLGLTPVYAYGEWMYPSFFYRSFREAMKAVGLTLPLNPQPFKSVSRFRKGVRMALLETPLPLYTGISIGVMGRK